MIRKKIKKYNLPRERFVRDLTDSAETVLSEIAERPNLPKGMGYFIDLMRNVFVKQPMSSTSFLSFICGGENKKIIGTYCLMVPEELIYAAGAIPVRLCGGSYVAATIGDDFVPRDACPVVKASIGFTASNLLSFYQVCTPVIVPTTCDSKRKMAEELSKFTEVWILDVPHLKEGEVARKRWFQQIEAMKKDLEKLNNKRIQPKNLQESIHTIALAQLEAQRLFKIRKLDFPVILGREAMLVLNAYSYDTAYEWTKALAQLNNELELLYHERRIVVGHNAPRILLAGCPLIFPNWKIPSLVEEMGAVIVVEESCMGSRYLCNPISIAEKTMRHMMAVIAARYLMPCICPSFSPNEDRLVKLLQLVKEFKVDGIIYHVLKGCILYDFEFFRVEKTMKEKGIPILRLETDYSFEDVEQIRTRVEAFIEMLERRKLKK